MLNMNKLSWCFLRKYRCRTVADKRLCIVSRISRESIPSITRPRKFTSLYFEKV